MATAPNDLAPIPFPGTMPPMPAVARILARFDRGQVEGFIAVALDLLDTLDGPADPDTPDFRPYRDGLPGDPADHEPAGDERDIAWREWSGLTKRQRAGNQSAGDPLIASWLGGQSEDDEDDDPAGQYDEDCHTARLPRGFGPGCTISDQDTGIEDQREGKAGLDC